MKSSERPVRRFRMSWAYQRVFVLEDVSAPPTAAVCKARVSLPPPHPYRRTRLRPQRFYATLAMIPFAEADLHCRRRSHRTPDPPSLICRSAAMLAGAEYPPDSDPPTPELFPPSGRRLRPVAEGQGSPIGGLVSVSRAGAHPADVRRMDERTPLCRVHIHRMHGWRGGWGVHHASAGTAFG